MRGRKQIRLKEYDYSLAGAYFVTICTKDRREMYGEIVDGEMIFNDNGKIVQSCWEELTIRYKNILLDEFIIMPNHVHGIVIIIDEIENEIVGARSPRPDTNGAGKPRPYEGPILGNISAYFKYQSTKRINEKRNKPGESVWQRNYYDHIIRNEKSLYKIRDYIRTNKERWMWDKENPSFQGPDEFDRWLKEEGKQKIKIQRIS